MQTLELNPPPATTSQDARRKCGATPQILPLPASGISALPPPDHSPTSLGTTGKVRKSKFNLTGLAPKESAKTTIEYPTVPDPTGAVLQLATQIKIDAAKLEVLEGSLETAKAQLRNLVEPGYFQIHSGKNDVPSSVAVTTPDGDVLVTFSSRYKKIENPDAIVQTFGDEFFETHFNESFKITIDGSQIPTVDPSHPDRNPAQEFINDIVAVVTKHNAAAAVKQETTVAPTKQFHDTRHQLLSPSQNRDLQQLCPMIVMIKTKGRDSK